MKLTHLIVFIFVIEANLFSQQQLSDIERVDSLMSIDIKDANKVFNSLKKKYLVIEIDSIYAEFYYRGGVINYYLENYLLAEKYYHFALITEYAHKYAHFEAKIHNNLGIVYELLLKFDEALVAYNRSINIEKKLKNRRGEMKTLLNIGLLNIKTKQYKIAEKQLTTAYAYFDSIKDEQQIGLFFQNLGVLYFNRGDYKRADSLAVLANEQFRKINDIYGLCRTFNNISLSNLKLGKLKQADQFKDSLVTNCDTNSSFYFENIPFLQAEILIAKKDYNQSLQLLNGLIEKNINKLSSSKYIEELKMRAYACIGEGQLYESAFDKYRQLSDSIAIINNIKQVAQLETIYKTNEMQQELSANKNLLLKERNKNIIIFTAMFIIISLLSGVLLFRQKLLRLRKYLINNAQRKQLKANDQELETLYEHPGLKALYIKCNTFLKADQTFLQPELSIDLLAEKLDVNTNQLSKSINENAGLNFNQFINQLRVKYSEKLLAENKYSVSEIAEIVGFSNRISFYRSFKHIVGISPTEFRENITNNVLE